MNPEDERKKAADTAAGQKAYIASEFPSSKVFKPHEDPGTMKLQIIKICVEAYVDEAEKEKKRLIDQVEVEKMKNRDIKDIAERLAMELDKAVPGHQLANDTLAMLLENKMMPGQAPLKRKK